MMQMAIYAIRNIENGHLYIGSSVDFVRRSNKHKRELRNGTHHSEHLQRSYNKYGDDRFEFSIVEYVDSRSRLLEREQVWIDFFKPNYNIAKIAGSPTTGLTFSAETRARMSAAHKGKKRAPMTEEWRAKISASKTGKPFTPEALASHREKRNRLFSDPAFLEKWRSVRRGKTVSDATRAKLSAAGIGNKRGLGFKHAPGTFANRRRGEDGKWQR